MSRRDPSEPRPEDAGFTLIELLVVILIIGILAAIAVPIFLSQRSKATDSAIQSDINSTAQFEESYFVSAMTYGTFADLLADGSDVRASDGVTLTIVSYDDEGYCIEGIHPQTSETWFYDSQAGGIQPRGSSSCPVSTGGSSGGSVTG